MKFALLNYFFVDLGLCLWPGGVSLWLLGLIEALEVQILMSFQELFVWDVLVEVHIIEMGELLYRFAFMGESVGGLLIFYEIEFGCPFGGLDDSVLFLVVE